MKKNVSNIYIRMNSNCSNNMFIIIFFVVFLITYKYVLINFGLPNLIKDLFNNSIFRMVFLALLLVNIFNKSILISIMILIIYVITLDYLYQQEVVDNLINLESFNNLKGIIVA